MNVAPPESPSAPIASFAVLPPPGLCVKLAEKEDVPLAVPVAVTLFVPQRFPLGEAPEIAADAHPARRRAARTTDPDRT